MRLGLKSDPRREAPPVGVRVDRGVRPPPSPDVHLSLTSRSRVRFAPEHQSQPTGDN